MILLKLKLDIHFETDGDFCFLGLDDLIDPSANLYKDVVKYYCADYDSSEEAIDIRLECEGAADPCRWASRDVLTSLIEDGIRTCHFFVVKLLYDLLIGALDTVFSSSDDVDYQDTIDGNYEGTYLQLKIIHEDNG